LIDLHGYGFDIGIEDVETLNQKASKGTYDITKLSFAAFGSLMDDYALLRTGSALGMGCGPMIISLPGRVINDKNTPVIAVPGMGTTAYHLFRFYMDDLFCGMEVQIIPMAFEKIMPAVIEKKADFGVIIHEGRFVYQTMGLELKADLGAWWEDKTCLPIPLGCIAVKRDMNPAVARDIQNLIGQSIDHAFLNPYLAHDYIQEYAQELNDDIIRQHIELYVNDFSKDIGKNGEAAITAFFEKARTSGLIKKSNQPLFACPDD
ncbi:MAG: 1,4-dihydroxy-6-naphthoate synthase, partial [Proteobacteria bacterium]|nr:1,4-dihydroxy-6-naphthoate synthase [Pseudomonadota bacterium]